MSSKPSVYSKEKILEAAFALLRKEGWDGVSTRAIADWMGSSTMPIYSHLESVEELQKELRRKALQLQREYQQRRHTEHALLNLAYGYVIFARDEKNLFRFLYSDWPDKINWGETAGMKDTFFAQFGEESEEVQALSQLEATEQETLITYTWIFTHGLAAMANSGAFDAWSDQVVLQFLMDAGEAFYLWASNKGGDARGNQDG